MNTPISFLLPLSCLFLANDRECSSEVAASLGKSLFGKAISCAVFVVKGSHAQDGSQYVGTTQPHSQALPHVQDGAATSRVCREISVSNATNGAFGKLLCYLSV